VATAVLAQYDGRITIPSPIRERGMPNRTNLCSASLLVAWVTTVSGCAPRPAASIPSSDRSPGLTANPTPPGGLVGSAGCSNRSCHGSDNTDSPASAISFTTWLSNDPHAGAFNALRSRLSKQITANLGISDAASNPQCLACHTNPALARAAGCGEELRFGVGCEACHGPAQKWLRPHATAEWLRAWEDGNPKIAPESNTTGIIWLRVPAARAQQCVGCHVGSPADPCGRYPRRDVNHDLIAAGHPPLRFEFATYMANLPRHWAERPSRPQERAREWAVGQAVAGQAAYQLLAARAIDRETPWPEFAEYVCSSCHREPTVTDRGGNPGPPRQPRFGGWNHQNLELLAGLPKEPLTRPAAAALGRSMGDGRPSRFWTAMLGLAAAHEAGRLKEASFDNPQLDRLVERLTCQAKMTIGEWDGFSQAALGLAAVYPPGGPETETITQLLKQTAFPSGWQTPRGFNLPARKIEREALLKKLEPAKPH
jgi:hypothetical protein